MNLRTCMAGPRERTEPDERNQGRAGREDEAVSRPPKVKPPVPKRSIAIAGHKTSIALENAFWVLLKEIAAHEGVSVATLVNRIDMDREHANLSSQLRLYVLDHYRRLAEEAAPEGER